MKREFNYHRYNALVILYENGKSTKDELVELDKMVRSMLRRMIADTTDPVSLYARMKYMV